MTPRPRNPALVALALLLVACQGRTSVFDGGGGGRAPSGRGGIVQLSAADLAPVDAYIHHKTGSGASNTRWILADDVEVVASREYFGQNLTFTRASGLVERVDDTRAAESRVTLRYRGAPGTESVTTNPRVLIGTGLTISARRTLVVRLVATRDASRPVYLRVTARGRASRGHQDTVEQRAPQLDLGGELRRSSDGRTTWKAFG